MRGTESEVAGMISATSSMKTVRDSSTVIPDEEKQEKEIRSEFLLCSTPTHCLHNAHLIILYTAFQNPETLQERTFHDHRARTFPQSRHTPRIQS